ncbi:SWI/SNF and RSC complexes subunit arp9 [Smittium mucronatum]|uniref:SWI/SNF and RSC complexes subunit arp9 n=1 Tax=Smittium mucronatum TaxID=133383 RepID=A0A1R0H3I2_9FUNG|nr:SWI/SNF and RSC complexes subunit arp9 [Smittium mucronatum]
MYSFKEEDILVVEFEDYETLATLGTADINQKPTLRVKSRIASIKPNPFELPVTSSSDFISESKVGDPSPQSEFNSLPNTPKETKSTNESASLIMQKEEEIEMDVEHDTLSEPNKNTLPIDIHLENPSPTKKSDNITNTPTKISSQIVDSSNALAKKEKNLKNINNIDTEMDLNQANERNIKNPEENSVLDLETELKNDKNYIFGDSINAVSSDSLEFVSNIFDNDKIIDWSHFKEFCKYILLKELKISVSKNESPIILSVPHSWTKFQKEDITKMLFEEFNVPAMMIIERPLAAIFGNGLTSGLVIDVSFNSTSEFLFSAYTFFSTV